MPPQTSLFFGSSGVKGEGGVQGESIVGLLIFQHIHLPDMEKKNLFSLPVSVLANVNLIGFALCKNSLISRGVPLTNIT